MTRPLLFVLLSLSAFACAPAKTTTGECLGWSCDEDGAREMMKDTLASKYEPSEAATKAFEVVMERGVAKMSQQGLTPESFELAKGNLEKYLTDIPDGVDPLTPALEELGKGTARACSLWPYC